MVCVYSASQYVSYHQPHPHFVVVVSIIVDTSTDGLTGSIATEIGLLTALTRIFWGETFFFAKSLKLPLNDDGFTVSDQLVWEGTDLKHCRRNVREHMRQYHPAIPEGDWPFGFALYGPNRKIR